MARRIREVGQRRGRPRKFIEPSRAVTLTLPEPVIAALLDIDHDLSRAVVRLAQPELARQPHPPVELASFGRNAVIVVSPTRTLEDRTGVLLIPLSDGRALISFDEPITIARLELSIRDVLEDPTLTAQDGRIFTSIADVLKAARRSRTVTLCQRNIIVLESSRGARRRVPRPVRRRVPGRRDAEPDAPTVSDE
jgi:hypothetical protein